MDHEDLLEFREEMGAVFGQCIDQTLEYHKLNLDGPSYGGSTINENFGYIEERTPDHPKTEAFILGFSMEQKAHRAKKVAKPGDEWQGQWDCKIWIPTQHILDQGCHPLDRDHAFFRLDDGTEWKIEAIRDLPKTGNGSIMTLCYVSKRKPQEDNPGGYG